MPRRGLTPCTVPGCPALVRSGRCQEHDRQADRARGSAAQRGYDRRWRRTARWYLHSHPVCECTQNDCHGEQACTAAAQQVDHKDGLGPHGPLGHHPSNLQALCPPCHSRKTNRQDGGAWGHASA